MKSILQIETPGNDRCFEVRIHPVNVVGDFFLDPEAFYRRWEQKVPELPHHEFEILVPGREFLSRFREQHIIHVHDSERTGAPFICWTGRVATSEEVRNVLTWWCMGTAASMHLGKDMLGEMLNECKRDTTRFFEIMWERYGVSLVNVQTIEEEVV
ncbi:MAG: hypothetical protein HYY10_00685 [Candidatus Liptonbacteria bacterium]|nr:hypothetical protein [Candidatus Liptonbacteria bacterium]